MLKNLGNLIEKKPLLIVTIIITITIFSAILIPSMKMETSTEDFMPDDEIVNANQRVAEYFGQDIETIMILVEKQDEQNVVTSKALREQYQILKSLEEKFDELENPISVASFIDTLCKLEFGETLLNCTDEQIETAYNDIMASFKTDELKMLSIDDKNEEFDFDPYPKLPGAKKIDSLDVKNYYIDTDNETFLFAIEVYDISKFKNGISSPHSKINTWEWYIDFENLIKPYEEFDMNYQIAAHIEPSKPLWEIGKGIIWNIREIFNNIKNRQLFNSYKSEAYLWIKAPSQDISFPIILETGNITFNIPDNRVEIVVDKAELGKYGIAPRFGNLEMPAKIGNTKAGVKVYNSLIFNQPWRRITADLSFIKKLIEGIQNRPIINSISTRVLQRFGDFSWEDFDELFSMLNSEEFSKESLSLKDISNSWLTLDEAPDLDKSESIYFVKSLFVEDLKSAAIGFLSQDIEDASGPSKTLMIIQLNIDSNGPAMGMMTDTLGEISREIKLALSDFDNKESYVSMKASGNGIISNEMNELTEEANMIIMPAIFIVICLILLVMFRQVSYIILPLVSLGISIIWLFGTMVLLGISFNMMMVAIVPLLMGLGVDYSVHIFHEYRSELKKGKKPGPAIVAAIQDIGLAMTLATLTTVIAFLSFLTAALPPLREFGVLCALGLIYTLITALTFQTAMRYLLDRKKADKIIPKSNRKISLDRYMEKFSNIVLKRRKLIIVFTIFITIFMLIGATQVETTFDLNDFLPEDNESMELMINIGEFFPSSSETQEYILIEGTVASVETLKGISETYENLKDDEYVTINPDGDPKETSILSIIRQAMRDNSTLSSTFNINSNGIPDNDADVVAIYDYLYDQEEYMMEVRSVLHREKNTYDATVMRIYTSISYSDDNTVDSNLQRGIIYNDLIGDLESYGDADAIVAGMSSAFYTIMGSMTESQILSTFISIILASLVLIIVFRNPILGAIAVIPVGLCIIWIIGTIYFLGYSLNIMTIMVTSLTIGIGIDYAIHATQRFRLTADRTGDVKKAVSKTIGHTGGALFIAALTTASGFGMLILAPMPPEQQFGIIVSMTIVYSYITSIIVLPPILMKWGKWRKKKKGFIISPSPPEKNYLNNDK